MIPILRRPAHPGEILRDEFLRPHAISAADLAGHLRVALSRMDDLLEGRAPVSAELAWRLAQVFRTTPELWMNLQVLHDLAGTRPSEELAALVPAP